MLSSCSQSFFQPDHLLHLSPSVGQWVLFQWAMDLPWYLLHEVLLENKLIRRIQPRSRPIHHYYMLLAFKGTAHQMYECVSDVLLHLDRMLGIVFMVPQRPSRSAACTSRRTDGTSRRTRRHFSKDTVVHFVKTRFFVFWP